MMFVSFNSNTTGVTCGVETANPPGAHEFIPVFSEVPVARSLVFCIMFCRSLFVLFLLVIAFSVLRFTASDYLFGILDLRRLITSGILDLRRLITSLVS
jgi:hypothetical protein